MTTFRKTIAATLAALAIGSAAVTTTATPAAAWGGYGWHHGWGGPGLAAGVIGGLALGAVAAGAAGAYDYGCVARQPVVDAWGNVVAYRRVRVAC